MKNQIIKHYLLRCQEQLLELSSSPVISRLSYLYNELGVAIRSFKEMNVDSNLIMFGNMIQGDTLDIFNSRVSRLCKELYWNQKKPAKSLITEVLNKEYETFRLMSQECYDTLSSSMLSRAMEKAPLEEAQFLEDWNKKGANKCENI